MTNLRFLIVLGISTALLAACSSHGAVIDKFCEDSSGAFLAPGEEVTSFIVTIYEDGTIGGPDDIRRGTCADR